MHTLAESNESFLLYSLCSVLPQWSTLASYVNITIGAHCLTILTANECQFLFLDYFDIFSFMCSNTSALLCESDTSGMAGIMEVLTVLFTCTIESHMLTE